jgi:NTE family protein
VLLLAPRLDNESYTKDIDFSPAGICKRWETGYADTMRALTQQPWIGEFDFLDAVVVHKPDAGPAAEQPSGKEVATPHKHAAE